MRYLLFSVFFIWISETSVFGQDRTIQVNVSGNFRPSASQGFIFVKQKVIPKPVMKVEMLADENMLVSIPYQPQEIEDGAFATAVLFGPQGEVAFGDVKLVTDSASTKSFYSLPDCQEKVEVPPGLSQQIGLLESLVEIRAARREAHQLRLRKTLDDTFLEKLRRLERGFGLSYSKKLSPDLSAFELVDRLSRLSNAIKNYQSNKK